MAAPIAYTAVLLAVLWYLSKYGGRTGRWAGMLQLTSWAATLLVTLKLYGTPYYWPMLQAVDFTSFGWKLTIALRSSRRWPIWMAGFQLNTVAAHVTIWVVPHFDIHLYYAMYSVWGMPALLVMIIGTAFDHEYDMGRKGNIQRWIAKHLSSMRKLLQRN